MTTPPIRITIPAHRFAPADRATDFGDGKDGLCDYYHRVDGSSGEFCSNAAGHSVHHGSDLPLYAHDDSDALTDTIVAEFGLEDR